MDKTIMDTFLGLPPTPTPFDPSICQLDDLQKFEEIRGGLLLGKGLTPEQIDHQLSKDRERRRQTLDNLNDLLAQLGNLTLPPLVSPDPACPEKGILPSNPPIIAEFQSDAYGALFGAATISFMSDLVSKHGILNMILSDVRGSGLRWPHALLDKVLW